MASIVNTESLGFDEIIQDIEKFIALEGAIDLSQFHESSTVRRLTSALAAIYNQTNLKISSVQREGIMHSALKPDSIKYLAQSQLAYHPKRKIAPQHPINTYFRFKAANNAFNEVNGEFERYAILGNISVNDVSYPISIIDAKTFEIEEGEKDEVKIVKCRLGIGSWREVTITVDEKLGHLEPYHVFYIDEEKDVIDDSGSVHIAMVNTNVDREPEVINDLYDISNLRETEKLYKVLVTSNYYGGLDINFGDGLIFGNLLYTEKKYKDSHNLNRFTVWYFVTPGFLPNLNFTPDNISWDTAYVDDTWFEEKWTEETAAATMSLWNEWRYPEETDNTKELISEELDNLVDNNGDGIDESTEDNILKKAALKTYLTTHNTNEDDLKQAYYTLEKFKFPKTGENGQVRIQNLLDEIKQKGQTKINEVLNSFIDPARFNVKIANGIDEESIAQIKTLSPYVAMSNNRIMTNDDFITRVRRIPQIKACASRPRHIEPGEAGSASVHNERGIALPLTPTATFELTGLTYRPPSDPITVTTWDEPPIEEGETTGRQDFPYGTVIKIDKKSELLKDRLKYITESDGKKTEVDQYWILTARIFQSGAQTEPVKYMYDPGNGQPVELTLYYKEDGDIGLKEVSTWYEWSPMNNKVLFYVRPNEVEVNIPIWEEIEEADIDLYIKTAYQPLTQMEWDLNFHTQYNFDILLGFMRVRVLPPIEHPETFEMTIVLKQNLDINARSQFEIDRIVRSIINEYCWELGVFLDTGKMVSDILAIGEVLQCYLHSPISNRKYATTHYIKPTIKLKYQTTSKIENSFYKRVNA